MRGWDWEVKVHRNFAYHDRLELFFFNRQGEKIQTLQFIDGDLRKVELQGPGEEVKPGLCLNHDEAMGIFNALWEDGFRPKDRRYENELGLVNRHLEDMRRLVFKGASNTVDNENP